MDMETPKAFLVFWSAEDLEWVAVATDPPTTLPPPPSVLEPDPVAALAGLVYEVYEMGTPEHE